MVITTITTTMRRSADKLLTDLMLRRPRSGRLEAWAAAGGPSFETHRFAMLLRMRLKPLTDL
jgi:hypothetical protein